MINKIREKRKEKETEMQNLMLTVNEINKRLIQYGNEILKQNKSDYYKEYYIGKILNKHLNNTNIEKICSICAKKINDEYYVKKENDKLNYYHEKCKYNYIDSLNLDILEEDENYEKIE